MEPTPAGMPERDLQALHVQGGQAKRGRQALAITTVAEPLRLVKTISIIPHDYHLVKTTSIILRG
jgi:hypothetical protein